MCSYSTAATCQEQWREGPRKKCHGNRWIWLNTCVDQHTSFKWKDFINTNWTSGLENNNSNCFCSTETWLVFLGTVGVLLEFLLLLTVKSKTEYHSKKATKRFTEWNRVRVALCPGITVPHVCYVMVYLPWRLGLCSCWSQMILVSFAGSPSMQNASCNCITSPWMRMPAPWPSLAVSTQGVCTWTGALGLDLAGLGWVSSVQPYCW